MHNTSTHMHSLHVYPMFDHAVLKLNVRRRCPVRTNNEIMQSLQICPLNLSWITLPLPRPIATPQTQFTNKYNDRCLCLEHSRHSTRHVSLFTSAGACAEFRSTYGRTNTRPLLIDSCTYATKTYPIFGNPCAR